MDENLPPLPGTEPPTRQTSLIAYILRGSEWVEIGRATPHADGKGHQLRLEISPADGEVIELRALDPAHYPGGGKKPRRNRGWRPRPRA